MSTYHRLPPISRTPSPPTHHHHAVGRPLPTIPESDSPSDSASLSPPRKKRKAKRRFLSLGKDPNGKWKKRRQLREEREIQRALESNDPADSGSDEDMLDSITVSGGVLLIGEGSTNPRGEGEEEAKPKEEEGSRKRKWEGTARVKGPMTWYGSGSGLSREKGDGSGDSNPPHDTAPPEPPPLINFRVCIPSSVPSSSAPSTVGSPQPILQAPETETSPSETNTLEPRPPELRSLETSDLEADTLGTDNVEADEMDTTETDNFGTSIVGTDTIEADVTETNPIETNTVEINAIDMDITEDTAEMDITEDTAEMDITEDTAEMDITENTAEMDITGMDTAEMGTVDMHIVEPDPVEPDPVEADPVEMNPVETDPVEMNTVEADPVEMNTVEADPVEMNTVEADPVEMNTVEADPVKADLVVTVETDPVEADPIVTVETDPVEADPIVTVEKDPVETDPIEMRTGETDTSEIVPGGTDTVGMVLTKKDPVEIVTVAMDTVQIDSVEMVVETDTIQTSTIEPRNTGADNVDSGSKKKNTAETDTVEMVTVGMDTIESGTVDASTPEKDIIGAVITETCTPIIFETRAIQQSTPLVEIFNLETTCPETGITKLRTLIPETQVIETLATGPHTPVVETINTDTPVAEVHTIVPIHTTGTDTPVAEVHAIAPVQTMETNIPTTEIPTPRTPPLETHTSQRPNEPLPLETHMFHIHHFPHLTTPWQISTRDMCPPHTTTPNWSTLSLIIQDKLDTPLTSHRVLLNWKFWLSSQSDLDAAIAFLLGGVGIGVVHDITVLNISADGTLPRRVADIIAVGAQGEGKGRAAGTEVSMVLIEMASRSMETETISIEEDDDAGEPMQSIESTGDIPTPTTPSRPLGSGGWRSGQMTLSSQQSQSPSADVPVMVEEARKTPSPGAAKRQEPVAVHTPDFILKKTWDSTLRTTPILGKRKPAGPVLHLLPQSPPQQTREERFKAVVAAAAASAVSDRYQIFTTRNSTDVVRAPEPRHVRAESESGSSYTPSTASPRSTSPQTASEDGQDILHGADLLLWAAGAVDAAFAPPPPPPPPPPPRKSLIVTLKLPRTSANVSIPRPQPYRRPESTTTRRAPPKPRARPSSVDALAAARRAKAGAGTATPGVTPAVVGSPDIPRPAYAKPGTTMPPLGLFSPLPARFIPALGGRVDGMGESSPPPVAAEGFPREMDAMRTPPFLGVSRSTLTPEYGGKRVVPLVSKNNFLYWEPSMLDVKPPMGDVANGSPLERGPYQSPPPLQPLSDTIRPTTAPPLQPLQDSVAVAPADMVFNIERYEKPERKTVIYGRDILAAEPTEKPFAWDKFRALLEATLNFDDFRECLIINYRHMVEDEAELNEGLEWYKLSNEVVVAKVDSVGKPPAALIARMKIERKALRERCVAV